MREDASKELQAGHDERMGREETMAEVQEAQALLEARLEQIAPMDGAVRGRYEKRKLEVRLFYLPSTILFFFRVIDYALTLSRLRRWRRRLKGFKLILMLRLLTSRWSRCAPLASSLIRHWLMLYFVQKKWFPALERLVAVINKKFGDAFTCALVSLLVSLRRSANASSFA